MSDFDYSDDLLHAEAVNLVALADEIGTPFYCYSAAAMTARYRLYTASLEGLPYLVCFAMKANSNQAVLRLFAGLGAGMDVVSEGELRRARAAGVPGARITFSGVGKSARELALGLDEDILCFNVESEWELRALSDLACSKTTTARIALRVNPDIDAKTHAKISTGKAENKFGIPITRAREVYREAAALPGLSVTGIDMHIGSQLTDLDPFDKAFGAMADLLAALRQDGHDIHHVDLGGGLGIPYTAGEDSSAYAPDRYATLVKRHFGNAGVTCLCEPGRFLVGNAGVLVTRVILVKTGEDKRFIVADAAMNDLIRPTLYEAHHEILPVRRPPAGARSAPADVVGPICETGDYLALGRDLPPVEPGDLLAVMSAGAYGAVQAGTYNTRLLVPEVMVSGTQWAVIRPKGSYDDLIGLDRVPAWIG